MKIKSNAARVEAIEEMLRARKPEMDLSRFTQAELKELAEINRSARLPDGVSDIELLRYQEIIKAGELRREL